MKRSRFTEDQIIGILKEHEAGVSVADLCRKHGVSDATVYKWKAKYGGMDVSEAKRLKGLEDENARLKRLLADAMLDNAALKVEPLKAPLVRAQWRGWEKSGSARREAASGRASGGGPRDERAAGVPGDRLLPDDHAV